MYFRNLFSLLVTKQNGWCLNLEGKEINGEEEIGLSNTSSQEECLDLCMKEKDDGGRNFQTPAWEYSHQFNAKKCCSIVISVLQRWSFANMYISDFTIMILQKYTRQHTEALKPLIGCSVSLSLRCAMSKNVMI